MKACAQLIGQEGCLHSGNLCTFIQSKKLKTVTANIDTYDVDTVARMENFRTLKLSQLESFRALKLSRLENFLTLKY